jgi:hypothetical protein
VPARGPRGVLYRARLVCSGEECLAEYEVLGTAAEIEALACDCGLGLQVLGWPEEEAGGPFERGQGAVRLTVLPLGSSPE